MSLNGTNSLEINNLISPNKLTKRESVKENSSNQIFEKNARNSLNVYDKIKSEKCFRENHSLFNKCDSIKSMVEDFIKEYDEDQIANKEICITIMKSLRIVDAYEAEVSQSRFDILTPVEIVNKNDVTRSDSAAVICSLEEINEKIRQGARIPNLNMDHKSSKVEYLTGHDYNVHIVDCDSEVEVHYDMDDEDNEYDPVNIKNASFEVMKPSNVPPYIQTVINFGTPDDPYLHFSIDAIHEKSDDGGLFDDENELDIFPDGVRGLKENILDFNITSESIYNIISLTQEKHPNVEIDEIFTNVHFLFPKLGSLKVLKNVVGDIERQIGKIERKDNNDSKSSFIVNSWCNNCCLFMDCTCEKNNEGTIPLSYVTKLPYDDSEYKDMCGVDCYKNKSNLIRYPKDISEYSKLEQIRFKQYYILFGNRSCHIKDTLITDEGVIAKCYRIKFFLDKFCKDLPTKQYIKMTPAQQTLNTYQTFANVARRTILTNESEYGNDDKYSPCKHVGECSEKNNCPCIKSKHACFNMCQCLPSCPSKFTGCNCKSGNCSTTKCPCVKLGWECVSTYCKNCNCDITVDVSINEMCRNSFLQRGFSKRLDIKESTIAGFGAFATDLIKKGEFISEYKGEIISQEESERRGRVYDSIKMNYLFKLNQLQQVDAYHYGNVCRFINHSDTNPNVHAKIIVVSGMQKIALIALRNIDPGEELFFNYNYTKHQTKNFVKNISGPQGVKRSHRGPIINSEKIDYLWKKFSSKKR
uniref:[histone H3]-lysine(27) N-trimethyltransferase n=1 Tax=Strongyloides venezuelensis TaxID=75913 RepID=A0A0K0FYT6_STRVS